MITLKFLKTMATLAVGALGVAGAAQAQSTWSWQMDPPPGTTTCTSPTPGNSYGSSSNCTSASGGQIAAVSVWSAAQGGLAEQANHDWHGAELTPQGSNGFGAGNRGEGLDANSPHHSIDNVKVNASGALEYDFMMVQFSSAVILEQFGVGWGYNDSDATLMRWTGDAAPTTQNSGQSLLSTIGTGAWAFVGDYSNVCKNSSGADTTGTCDSTKSRRDTGTDKASSYWLIAAYNTTMSSLDAFSSETDDGFKVNFLKAKSYLCPGGGNPTPGGNCGGSNGTPVSEPGSMALAAAAFLGLAISRRRKVLRA